MAVGQVLGGNKARPGEQREDGGDVHETRQENEGLIQAMELRLMENVWLCGLLKWFPQDLSSGGGALKAEGRSQA
jgi:hypothetical protein